MKQSLLILCLAISISSALAQPPVIDYMLIDESKGTLSIHGDFGPTQGEVWCDTVELPILEWAPSLITTFIPDTGKGSAGPVVVGKQSNFSKERMITRWDVDYGTVRKEAHSRYVITDYKKVFFSFRADIHSMILRKTFTNIHTQLMKNSICSVWYSDDSYFEEGNLPFSEASIVNDSSFHATATLSFNERKGHCWLYDIKWLATRSIKSWIDSSGPHDTVLYGKRGGESFGISFKFDSLFQIIHDRHLEGQYGKLDSTNIVQVSLYAPPPLEAYAEVKAIKAQIHIFPNPSHNSITFVVEPEADIEVIDILGRSIATSKGRVKTWIFSPASKGIYFANIVSGDNRELRKLIVE